MTSADSGTSGRRLAVRVHLLLVSVLTVLFVASLVADAPGSGQGANIGLGLLLIPTLALGVPWSAGSYLLLHLDGVSERTPVALTLVLLAQLLPMWLNVAVHRWVSKRVSRRGEAP